MTTAVRNFSKPTLFFSGGPEPQDPIKGDARHVYAVKARKPINLSTVQDKDHWHMYKLVRVNMDVHVEEDRRQVLEGYYEFTYTTNAPGIA